MAVLHFKIAATLFSVRFRTRLARPAGQDVEAVPRARLVAPPGQSHGLSARVRALVEQLLRRPVVAFLEFISTF